MTQRSNSLSKYIEYYQTYQYDNKTMENNVSVLGRPSDTPGIKLSDSL